MTSILRKIYRTSPIQRLSASPRKSLLYGLLSLLIVLLLAFVVNQKNWTPVQGKETWRVRSNYSNDSAKKAIDFEMETSWNSYLPISSGLFFEVDTLAPKRLNGIVLDLDKEHDRGGHPVYWTIKTSLDGQNWHTAHPWKHLIHRSMFVAIFPTVHARYIRVINTYSSNRKRWSISELELLQPVVPWQIAPLTFFFWIFGVILTIVFFLFMSSSQNAFCRKDIYIALFILTVLLLGWGMRVYNLGAYEFSDREVTLFPLLQVHEPEHPKWFRNVTTTTPLGSPWLGIFFMRLACQSFENLSISMRLVPSILSFLSVALILLYGCKPGQLWSSQHRQFQPQFWERFGAGASLGLASYPIMLSRHGELSASSLAVLLLYLFFSYRFLYQRASYRWLPVLSLLLFIGFFLDPLIVTAPAGIMLFGAARWAASRLSPSRKREVGSIKSAPLRRLWYGISCVPFYAFIVTYFMWQGGGETFFKKNVSFQSLWQEILFALQSSGFTGLSLWLIGGLACLGLCKLAAERKLEELFVLFLAGFLPLAGGWIACIELTTHTLLLVGIFFWLIVKGGMFLLLPIGKKAETRRPYVYFSLAIVGAGYLLLFSVNSLFWGKPFLPQSSELFAKYQQEKQIQTLHQHIHADPDECKSTVSPDPIFADMHSMMYPAVNTQFTPLDELQRLAELGRFKDYALLPISSVLANQEFLQRYYDLSGQSSRVALFSVKPESLSQRQHYTWQDLSNNVGRDTEDVISTSGTVKTAYPKDKVGYLSFAPHYPICQSGHYIASFIIRSGGAEPDEVVASLKVNADSYDTVARRYVWGKDFPNPGKYYRFDLPFELDVEEDPAFQMKRLQFLVKVLGNATVQLDYVELLRLD